MIVISGSHDYGNFQAPENDFTTEVQETSCETFEEITDLFCDEFIETCMASDSRCSRELAVYCCSRLSRGNTVDFVERILLEDDRFDSTALRRRVLTTEGSLDER